MNGNCANISKFISNYYSSNISAFEINGDVIQPCGNCNYECLRPGMQCPNTIEAYESIMDTVCNSDLVFFIVPNYCGYPCANYFAFNERSVGYFNMDREKMKKYMDVPKRFIIVSNTEGFEETMRQQTNGEPEILYLKTRKYGRQSITGDILESQGARNELLEFLNTSEKR